MAEDSGGTSEPERADFGLSYVRPHGTGKSCLLAHPVLPCPRWNQREEEAFEAKERKNEEARERKTESCNGAGLRAGPKATGALGGSYMVQLQAPSAPATTRAERSGLASQDSPTKGVSVGAARDRLALPAPGCVSRADARGDGGSRLSVIPLVDGGGPEDEEKNILAPAECRAGWAQERDLLLSLRKHRFSSRDRVAVEVREWLEVDLS
ncbi:unnamed protein product [Diplocarpon coronariae]|uniref:Uncharacterized protein n=1 Tax=Diplocarpon coronariae TaxID=2795749 RepID=A0A218YRV6_9HELO|nr:hypothetical protein JHW43_009215 [Diplocarpon mali]OWO97393.1 hypothetical protein B2J93_3093 [Marssonina coronariae]